MFCAGLRVVDPPGVVIASVAPNSAVDVLGKIGQGVDAPGAVGDPVRSHVAVHCELELVSPTSPDLAVCCVAGGSGEFPAVLAKRRRPTFEILHAVDSVARLTDRAQ